MAKYKKNNAEKTIKLFDERVIYNDTLQSHREKYSTLTDFNFGEKLLYGRVDRFNVPLEIVNKRRLKSIKSVSGNRDIRVLNFVADAFSDLVRQFDKKSLSGEIGTQDPFLTSLRAFKGYQDINKEYSSYHNLHVDILSKEIKRRNPQIMNFTEFTTALIPVFTRSLESVPLTKISYIKSRRCPMNVSGLVIDIANLKSTDDSEKINKFINSPNWEFYLNACTTYGFMVDKSHPWRLVADIGSKQMQQYAAKYDQSETDLVLWSSYNSSYLSSFNKFVISIRDIYHNSIKKTVTFTSECAGKVVTHYKKPLTYTSESLNKHFSERNMLELYCKLRLIEEEGTMPKEDKIKLLSDTLQLYDNKGIKASLFVFERIANKPFDKSGSLSYIVRRINARSEEP